MIPRLALRGAIKHWKRSLVVVGAVAVACAVMIAVGSLVGGITGSFFDSLVPNSGHVRIDGARAAEALNPFGLDTLVGDAAGMIASIEAIGDPRIVDAEGVLTFGALIVEDTSYGDPRNLPMRGVGVSSDTRFADNIRDALVAGSFLPGPDGGVALSESAARLVGAELGDGVLVLVQDKGGQPWYERLVVTGIFRTESKDFDETTFYMGAAKAAEMLDVAGSAREIRLLLASRDDAEAVAKEVALAVSGSVRSDGSDAVRSDGSDAGSAAGDRYRVMTWQAINSSFFTILIFLEVLFSIILGLFAIVAGTIVANTSLMSVMERLREFGTMRAIGLKARSLERLVVVEGAILGAAGALLGVALGSLVVALMSRSGIDLGGIMESLGLKRYNRPRPDLLWYLACAAVGLLVCVLATARAGRSVKALSVADSLAAAA